MEMDDIPKFYEGAEKLLEVWFEPITSSDVTNTKWLRDISRYIIMLYMWIYQPYYLHMPFKWIKYLGNCI